MARRLLCALALFLVLDTSRTYIIEDGSLDKATKREGMQASRIDDIDKLAGLMQEQEKQESEKQVDENAIQGDDSSIKSQVEAIAEELLDNCTYIVYPLPHGLSESLNPHYQALQHYGGNNFMGEEELKEAKESELCGACLLTKLCEREDVQDIVGVPAQGTPKEKEKLCRKAVLELRLKFEVNEHEPEIPECDKDAKFRTFDGTCNNLENPLYGAIFTPFLRLVPAAYGDGISSLRLSTNHEELPNAREISLAVHGSNADRTNPDSSILTVFFMNFGQYLDHDVTLALAEGIDCEPPESEENEECINIEIPEDDEIFRSRGRTFIELERDGFVEPEANCSVCPREHPNIITAFIDASNVYGSTDDVAKFLRAPGGLLRVMKHPLDCTLQDLLPETNDSGSCITPDPFRPCFASGDVRNNENAGLNSIHTIFVRLHNRIATFLGQMSGLDAETIYQLSRKILGAQQQRIVYNEFLPLVLSKDIMESNDLLLGEGFDYSTCYDKTIDPSISNAFSTAAYRFGHTLIPELFSRLSQGFFETKCDHCQGNKNFQPIALLDFGNPQYLYDIANGGVDSIVRGLANEPAGKVDGRFSSSVQENLVRGAGDLSDLVAINLQRSRERGVAGYTAYREFCDLPPVNNFAQLRTRAGFSFEDVRSLRRTYENVRDIDLFTGGLLEPKDPKGGLLGPTFQCLLAEQFKRLKCGDRFWHENEPSSDLHTVKTAFTPCQLKEIRKTLVSRIICDTSDDITAVNYFALQQSGIKVPCEKLPEVDLEPFLPGFQCEEVDGVYT